MDICSISTLQIYVKKKEHCGEYLSVIEVQ